MARTILTTRDGEAFQNAAASRFQVTTIDLGEVLDSAPVDCGGIRIVTAFTVLELVGRASVVLNGTAVPVRAGDVREGLDVSAMAISTAGTPGGTITLEIHGRP